MPNIKGMLEILFMWLLAILELHLQIGCSIRVSDVYVTVVLEYIDLYYRFYVCTVSVVYSCITLKAKLTICINYSENYPIIPELFLILSTTYYSRNYSGGMIDGSLALGRIIDSIYSPYTENIRLVYYILCQHNIENNRT